MLKDYIKYHDVLDVFNDLPSDEIDQVNELVSYGFNVKALANDTVNILGHKYTLFGYNNEPIVIGGFYEIVPNTWQTFMYVSKYGWNNYAKYITKTTYDMLNKFSSICNCRIQTLCLSSRIDAHRWYGIIGLEKECVLKSYSKNRKDVLVFTKINED